MGVNYGLNRVRFTAPVPVNSRLRGAPEADVRARGRQRQQMTWQVTVEREGGDKPVCVAESIARRY